MSNVITWNGTKFENIDRALATAGQTDNRLQILPPTVDSKVLKLKSLFAATPVNSGLPIITGATVQGSVLTTTNGVWAPAGTYIRQWKSGGVNVGNGGLTYTTVAGDVGKTITCTVETYGAPTITSAPFGPITSTAAAASMVVAPSTSQTEPDSTTKKTTK